MASRFTRRQIALALASASTAVAQTGAPVPANPDEDLQAARERNRRDSGDLAKFPLPMLTEPAFRFKA